MFLKHRFIAIILTGILIQASALPVRAQSSEPGDPPYLVASLPANRLALEPFEVADAKGSDPLNLDELGFSKSDTARDPKLQKLLDRRTKMLKIHQILGLTTGAVMALALASAGGAGGTGKDSKDSREDHEKMGIATGVLYFTTASFSIFAPKVPGQTVSGRTKIHKALAFIHFPAMVGTMILGISDKKKLDRGEKASGLKPAFATTAAVAFYTSLAVMVIPFGGKGDEK